MTGSVSGHALPCNSDEQQKRGEKPPANDWFCQKINPSSMGNTEYPVATDEIAHQFRESAMSILLSITADQGRAL